MYLLECYLVLQKHFNKILPEWEQKRKKDPQLSGNIKGSLFMPPANAGKKYCQQGYKLLLCA